MTNPYTPILGIDVDGPLNPWDNPNHRRPDGFESYRRSRHGWHTGRDFRRIKGMKVWLNPEHGPILTAFAARAGMELMWLTSWEHEANTYIGPAVGLPPLPVVEFPGNQEDGWARNGWKWGDVLRAAHGRPLAWLDDEFDERWNTVNRDLFLAARGGTPTLLHPVDPSTGVTDSDLSTVGHWAATLKGFPA